MSRNKFEVLCYILLFVAFGIGLVIKSRMLIQGLPIAAFVLFAYSCVGIYMSRSHRSQENTLDSE